MKEKTTWYLQGTVDVQKSSYIDLPKASQNLTLKHMHPMHITAEVPEKLLNLGLRQLLSRSSFSERRKKKSKIAAGR